MTKIALITGASRGIGAATAQLLARNGYDLCINYRRQKEKAEALAASLKQLGRRIICVQADVAREEDVVALFEAVDDQLGPLNALVNNAAQLRPQSKLVDMDAARINRIFSTNVTSSFVCCREAIKRMSRQGGGSGGAIVNVSSVASRLGAANEYIDYAASKGAIDTLTIGLARELAEDNIRVNAVRPGFIDTDMHADGGEPQRIERIKPHIPLKRGGHVDEVAHAIAWLLSAEASYVTGTFIDVAGGR